jgi:hypothetical protein
VDKGSRGFLENFGSHLPDSILSLFRDSNIKVHLFENVRFRKRLLKVALEDLTDLLCPVSVHVQKGRRSLMSKSRDLEHDNGIHSFAAARSDESSDVVKYEIFQYPLCNADRSVHLEEEL